MLTLYTPLESEGQHDLPKQNEIYSIRPIVGVKIKSKVY